MFSKVLIANRGEIAVRIIRTLREMGVGSVAVYSDPDRGARHVREADEAVGLGGEAASESYLRTDLVLQAARETGAEAIHPGYGFLSENTEFARACEAAGIAFIGPTPEQIESFGLKHEARRLAEENSVPLLPGSGLLEDVNAALAAAEKIGYPAMLKSTAGGGGIGMRLCRDADDVRREFETVRSLGRNNFAADGIFLERYVERARHVEVQIFGDGTGRVMALGERDCSVQRRNQKVIEETPAPGLSAELRERLYASAVRLAESVRYRSAGTVEFVYDVERRATYFLEVNTRLQVEHGVTENVTGVDLVEWMIRLAAGEKDFLREPPRRGHSIQTRLYAEDPAREYRPSVGLLDQVQLPTGKDVRVDAWIESGTEVSPYYDPLLAKIMVTGKDRKEALARLAGALAATRVYGIQTNLEFLKEVVAEERFQSGDVFTRMLNEFDFRPRAVEVLTPGMQTTVQDVPGRLGSWQVGVPPSGPMDALAFRIGNSLLGNDETAPGLEMTVLGAGLRFYTDTTICLVGADMQASWSDGTEVPRWRTVVARAGSELRCGTVRGHGVRAYLCVRGGLDVPEFLGSRATFALGQFGGHGGRTLEVGDMLHLALPEDDGAAAGRSAPAGLIPEYARRYEIGVLYGPHGAPDFFSDEYLETFFATDWEVHYNSARTGVRLIGPRPGWTREDGGEAGLHPSNIHDNAYAVGTVDFTGDMPIILGPDGPSLGGFVCPVTVVRAELWKTGQLAPGDRVRFVRLSLADALERERRQNESIDRLVAPPASPVLVHKGFQDLAPDAILHQDAGGEQRVAVCYRQAGDRYLLVEYGPMALEFTLRFRVHELMRRLEDEDPGGIVDLTPGIRSLQIHYDPGALSRARLLEVLKRIESELPAVEDMQVDTRIVHLPLSFDDPSTRRAVEIYQQSVWREAPWCPDNLEFIRRINGLDSVDRVREIVFAASYLVLGLGDVYLGAPVATPVDPRHRLVTTKYNPARTWTPQNAVGIGGAYMCIYGMEGPGGYQFVGRTCQVWNSYRQTREFTDGHPYLLRFFDQIRFYPVSPEELLEFRRDFEIGRARLKIERERFSMSEYRAFLEANVDSIAAFKNNQSAAFAAERERWKDLPPPAPEPERAPGAGQAETESELPAGSTAVDSPVRANVWKVLAEPGQAVAAGEVLFVLEAMKMEINVEAAVAGRVQEILCEAGAAVAPGQRLLVLERDV